MNSFVVVRLDGAALVWTDWKLDGSVAPELYRVLNELFDSGSRPPGRRSGRGALDR